jgi:type IV pilus assembly protein PilW
MKYVCAGISIMRLPLSNSRKERGFTLVELMIAMVAGALVLGAVMTSFLSQHRNYLAQDDVVEMQQNGRVAMDMLTRDIRMAGFDPTEDANATITDAQPGQFSFTQDITDNAGTGDSDGDVDDSGEEIDLGFGTGNDAGRDGIPDADADGDGVPDAASLGRQTGGAGGYQPIAENIQAIEFLYTIGDGAAAPTTTPPAAQYDNISAVQISILARASNPDQNFTNSMTYTTPSGATWGPFADNFRRRLFITTIKLRNL